MGCTWNGTSKLTWKSLSHVRLFATPWVYSPWNSSGQNTGMGILSLLQGIFPTQGLNPGLPHCRWILYQLSHKASPRILERVDYPFSSGSSQPRNRIGVSCITGGLFTNWAIREAPLLKTDKKGMFTNFSRVCFSLLLPRDEGNVGCYKRRLDRQPDA